MPTLSISHLAPLPASIFTLIAIASLLLTFMMLGSRWLRHYIYAFAAQSWLIGLLSAEVAFYGGFFELYIIAAITCLLRGLLLPYLLLVIMRRLKVPREAHVILQPSTTLVIAALVVVFALGVSWKITAGLDLGGTIAVLALTVMLAMNLLGYLVLGIRHEAMSHVLGLVILENGIFLGSQVLVPGMPFLLEMVTLFDLLVVVACFGVLVGRLTVDAGTTSSLELKRLVG